MTIMQTIGGWLGMSTPTPRDPSDDRWWTETGAHGGSARTDIGVTVTVERARQVPVVSNCLRVLAGTAAGLTFAARRRVDRKTVEVLDDHPITALFNKPNGRQTSFDFVYQIVDDLAAWGDYVALKIFDEGDLVALRRLDPARTVAEETIDGTMRFRFTDRFGTEHVYLEDEVWHIPLPPLVDDLVGRSPILHDGREAVAVAIALQRYANIFFTNDATPPHALAIEGSFKSPEDKKNFLDAWRRWTTGRNRHTPGLLEHGATPHRMGITNEEAQFLETRRELWLDLTRLWRVPPHKVGILDKATFSNIEHQSLEFVTDTLRPWLELIERSVSCFLIDEPDIHFEFNVESLLRGDIKTRYEAYAVGRQWGWISVNDILQLEGRNGIGAAGDRYIEPLNMVPVGTGLDRSERERRSSVESSIAFLRGSVPANRGGRPRLELVKDAA